MDKVDDYKEYSNNDIVEEIKNDKLDRELIEEALRRGNLNISRILSKKSKENESLYSVIESLIEDEKEGEILYYPNLDEYDTLSLPSYSLVMIPEGKKRLYKSINQDQNFSIKLRVKKEYGTLFDYELRTVSKPVSEKLSSLAKKAGVSLSIFIAAFNVTNNLNQDVALDEIESKVSKFTPLVSEDNVFEKINNLSKSVGVFSKDLKIIPFDDYDKQLIEAILKEKGDVEFLLEKEDIIASIESVVSPFVKDEKQLRKISNSIWEASQERKIDYLLFLSIMKVETTTFNQNAVSSTGDVSISQIKPEVWAEEFVRLGKEPLDLEKLKKDSAYAIHRMGEILEFQTRYKERDPLWYARYHSKTPSLKSVYATKVKSAYLKMREEQIIQINDKINKNLEEIQKIRNSDEFLSIRVLIDMNSLDMIEKELSLVKIKIMTNKDRGLQNMISKI